MTEARESAARGEVTLLLDAITRGDRHAAAELLPLVYAELRCLADSRLRRVAPGQTLQPTALVHEAYLRLVDNRDPGWDGRAHFFGAAAQAMRDVLVEQARRKSRFRHGGGWKRIELAPDATAATESDLQIQELLGVHAAVDRLRAEHPRKGDVVMLRYFCGLTEEQIAALLGVTTRTVNRDWRFARAWLYEALSDESQHAGS